ncbi:hypothetical protein D9758_014534 [Tetrapyrgos nigripes]|uniref:Uncharacterized protein n=1 Tax=Tetrapyrgos nigripes TaxID=182062 RepID=A0A8H5CT09_9AGAR|nr:hypothetical protein D9758_014534 [Tetrapyrgos nigripes]
MGRHNYPDLYSQQLLCEGHGYPLLDPEPHLIGEELRADFRKAYEEGVRVGDLGLVEISGNFKFIFNVFKPADDPINTVHGVPPDFQPLPYHDDRFSSRSLYHRKNASVCSKKARAVVLGTSGETVSTLFGPGLDLQFQFAQSEGAALFLPAGADRINYSAFATMREYITKNAVSWYQFVNELDLGAYNGCLYLITGYDRTSCYHNLAFSGSSFQSSLTFKFSSALMPTGNVGLSLSYSSVPSDHCWLGASQPTHTLNNLSPFIRGFKIMVKPSLLSSLKLSIRTWDPATAELLSKTRQACLFPNERFTPPGSSHSDSFGFDPPSEAPTPSSSDPSVRSEPLRELPPTASDSSINGDSDSTSRSSGSGSGSEFDSDVPIYQLYHPSDIINAYTLEKCPNVLVAITHDDEWLAVLKETDRQIPDSTTLITRMLQEHPLRFEQVEASLANTAEDSNDSLNFTHGDPLIASPWQQPFESSRSDAMQAAQPSAPFTATKRPLEADATSLKSSANRPQDISDQYGDYYDDMYYDDNRSDYTYELDDGDSANRIEVGSAQFDVQSYIEGPAVPGTWDTSSAGVSSSYHGRRASTTSSSASSNDWRRLLGPVNPSTTAVSPDFASTNSLDLDDEQPYDFSPPSSVDPMLGFNLPYIMRDLSSSSLPDFVSKSTTPEKKKVQEYTQYADLSQRRSYSQTPSPYQAPPLSPLSPTPTEAKQQTFPLLPVVQQLQESGAASLLGRSLSILSAQTTGTFALDDSFTKGLMTWSGEGYGSLRREWVMKKDKESSQYRNPSQNFGHGKKVWKGLYPGDKEVWHNYLLGNFSVAREDISSGTSSRTSNAHEQSAQTQSRNSPNTTKERETPKDRNHIQQRLVVRRLKEPIPHIQSTAIHPTLSTSSFAFSSANHFTAASEKPSVTAIDHHSSPPHNRNTDPSDERGNPHIQVAGSSDSATTKFDPLVSVGSDTTLVDQISHTAPTHTTNANATNNNIPSTYATTAAATTASVATAGFTQSNAPSSTKRKSKTNSDSRHPPVIVHRHSKVTAFSISRHYRSHATGGSGEGGVDSSVKGNSLGMKPKADLGPGNNDPSVRGNVAHRDSDVDRKGGRDRDREKGRRNRERGTTTSSSTGAGSSGSKRSQIVMLATREVQEQFFDAHSTARDTKNLLVGAGLAVDKRNIKEKERERAKEKERSERERYGKRKMKRKEKDGEKDKQSPRTHPSAVPKQKSESVLGSRSGGRDDISVPDPYPDVMSGFVPLSHKSSSSGTPHLPSSAVGAPAIPERPTRLLEVDTDRKDTQSMSHTKSESTPTSPRHDTPEQQHQQRPTRPRPHSLGQPQPSRTSPTQLQTQPESSVQRVSPSQQTAPGLLKRLLKDSSSTPSSSVTSSRVTGTTTNSVTGVNSAISSSASGSTHAATSLTIPSFRHEDVHVQRLKMLDDLETSLEHIGLLPPIHERERKQKLNKPGRQRLDIVASNYSHHLRESVEKGKGWSGQKKIAEEHDVISFIPRDALFMILPLWPEETDFYSQRRTPFVLPEMSEEERMYLLVFFKSTKKEEEAMDTGSQRGKEKDPTVAINMLLSSFHVVALIVSHEELQGIRVTLPKEGLIVTGSLEEAYKARPSAPRNYGPPTDCLLANCNSRETGLEFDPEALIQLGLCSVVNQASGGEGGVNDDPLPLGRFSEEFDTQRLRSSEVKLTPLGSAVMETIWCGSLALMSFGTGY